MTYMSLKLAALAAAALSITGCASMFTYGNDEYGCAGMSEGVQCLSAKEVYGLTEEPGPVTGDDYAQYVGQGQQASGEEVQSPATTIKSDPYAQAYREMLQNMPVNQESMPIRSRAQILRIWVAPWNSENGDHHQQGLIYTELDGRRWNMGQPGTAPANTIRPLGN